MIVTNENEIIVDAKRRRAPIIMSIHLSADLSCGSGSWRFMAGCWIGLTVASRVIHCAWCVNVLGEWRCVVCGVWCAV